MLLARDLVEVSGGDNAQCGTVLAHKDDFRAGSRTSALELPALRLQDARPAERNRNQQNQRERSFHMFSFVLHI